MKEFLPLITVLGAIVASFASAPAAGQPTTAATLAEFESVCKRLTSGDNAFFGSAVVSELQGRLAAGGLDPATEISTRMNLGIELVRHGRLAEAIAAVDVPILRDDADTAASRLMLLAIAHLQLAEERNCVELHGSASCILPIRPEAVHTRPEESRRAGDLYLSYLERNPDDLHIRWVFNLSRMISGDYPGGVPERYRLPEGALRVGDSIPRWTDVASELGVNAFDLAGGAVMDDFDGDGLLDLVSSSWHPCHPMKAFRNDGAGGFEDVTERWGLHAQLGGLNVVQTDYDNDGGLDLLVLRGAWLGREGRVRNSLLRNDLGGESGRFVDVTFQAGLAHPAYPTQAGAWADYDGDGHLDLYIGNEASQSSLMSTGPTGTPYPSQLYRNDGDGTFTDVARAAGVTNLRYAKGVAWGDYDGDGDPDLYVSNYGPNRLYRNDGDGTFTDVAETLGVTAPLDASFATWFFDWDNDGDLDIFANDYGAPVREVSAWYFGERGDGGRPLLHRNDGGRFTTLADEIGLDRPLLPMGANFGDLDNDGYVDLFLGTGVPDFDALMPDAVFRNVGGVRFEDVTFDGGFGHLQKGHGVAFGDIDNDGDQDVFHQLGGAYPLDGFGNALFENPGPERSWITLRLRGVDANRPAIGARIEVRINTAGGTRSVHATVGSGGSFGASSLQQEIGLADAEAIESIAVRWPGSARIQTFPGPIPMNSFYELTEGSAELSPLTPPRLKLGRTPSTSASTHERDPR